MDAPSREAAFLIRFDRDAAGVLTSVRSGQRRTFASLTELVSLLKATLWADARETPEGSASDDRKEVER